MLIDWKVIKLPYSVKQGFTRICSPDLSGIYLQYLSVNITHWRYLVTYCISLKGNHIAINVSTMFSNLKDKSLSAI